MSKNTITCELCHDEVHSIELHLKREHGQSCLKETCGLEEYKERFPTAPLLSDMAKARIEAAKEKKECSAEPAKRSTIANNKGAFADLYRLGNNPGAKRKDGSDMMVTVLPDHSDPEIAALVPKYNKGFVYDIDILKSLQMAFEMGKPAFAYGHSGLGKSSIFKQICSATNRPYVRVQHMIDTQYSHVIGQWTVKTKIDANGNAVSFTEWQWGPLPHAMLNGLTYNADEFDRCPPGVLSAYQAILEGEPLYVPEAPPGQRIITPHENFRFVATGNTNGTGDPHGLYQATMQMDAATMERFSIVVEMTYMGASEEIAMLMASTPVGKDHAKRLVEYSNAIRDKFPLDFDLTVGPRVLIGMAQMGIARGSFCKGIELAFANRLPADQRKSALDVAQRIFSD